MDHLNSSEMEREDARKVDLAAEAIGYLDLATARRLLEEVVANAPDEYTYSYDDEQRHFVKCWTLEEFRQYAAARPKGQPPAIWLSSAYPRAFYHLARIDNEEGKHEDALQHLDACLKLEPDQPLCFCQMAKAYASLGQHDKAADGYEQALSVRPSVTREVKAIAWRGKAELAELIGQTEQARQFAREAETYESPYAAAQAAVPGDTWREEEAFPSVTADSGGPACEVCGRRDSTLRFMNYPYIYSLILFSFPRAFDGLWCEKHCRLRWAIASAISTILGWLGIPFGLLQTPLILFRLARGGDCATELSVDLLKEIADERLEKGNVDSAVSCLEAVLQLEEDAEAEERLSKLYERRDARATGGILGRVWPIPVSLLLAGLVGMAIGMLDHVLEVATSAIVGQGEVSIYIGLLAWGPRVLAAFVGTWLLLRLLQWALSRNRCQQVALGVAVAIAAAALMWYGLPAGKATAMYLHDAMASDLLGLAPYVIRTLGEMVIRGGVWWIREVATTRELWSTIYLALLVGMAVYYVTASLSAALSTVRWQQRLAAARHTAVELPSRATILSWAAVAVVVLGLGVAAYSSLRPGAGDYYSARAHMEQAVEHWAADRFDQAIAELEEAVRLQPGWAEAHFALGTSLLQQGELREAVNAFQEATRLDPELAHAHSGLGWALLGLGELEGAAGAFQTAVDVEPELADAQSGLGLTLLSLGELEEAAGAFQAAVYVEPELAHAHSGLGWALYRLGELERAAGAFQTAVGIEPELTDAHLGLGQVYLAQDLHGRAADAFDTALELDAGSSDAWQGRGMVYLEEGSLDGAVEALATAVRLGPESPMARFQLGLVYTARGEFRDAVEQSSELSNLEPDWAAPHVMLAHAYYELDELDLMDSELLAALALGPDDPVSCHFLGALYYRLRRFSDAEAQLLRALDLWPEAGIYSELAYVYSALGEYEAALQMCDKALELEEDEAGPYTTRADVYIHQEKLDLALQELQRGLEVAPDDWEIYSSLSFIHFQIGDTDKAVLEAKRALELHPYSAEAHTRLAFAYREQGKLALALAAAQEAVRLAPKRDTSRFVLGVCYMDVGEAEKAIAELTEFLDLYWDRSYVREYKVQAERYLAQLLQE